MPRDGGVGRRLRALFHGAPLMLTTGDGWLAAGPGWTALRWPRGGVLCDVEGRPLAVAGPGFRVLRTRPRLVPTLDDLPVAARRHPAYRSAAVWAPSTADPRAVVHAAVSVTDGRHVTLLAGGEALERALRVAGFEVEAPREVPATFDPVALTGPTDPARLVVGAEGHTATALTDEEALRALHVLRRFGTPRTDPVVPRCLSVARFLCCFRGIPVPPHGPSTDNLYRRLRGHVAGYLDATGGRWIRAARQPFCTSLPIARRTDLVFALAGPDGEPPVRWYEVFREGAPASLCTGPGGWVAAVGDDEEAEEDEESGPTTTVVLDAGLLPTFVRAVGRELRPECDPAWPALAVSLLVRRPAVQGRSLVFRVPCTPAMRGSARTVVARVVSGETWIGRLFAPRARPSRSARC